ncbi:MAG: hydrogenase maturation nickel metallochaperone HypA [Acidobacteriaceae bacterium]|nr:hydrogenase maturation nickel metallochaperone HypA [Acidobacteriaceae bacterium]
MHELSVALSIIEGVEEEMTRHDGARVASVHLRLGPLSGVVKDALLFSYSLACEGTALANSKLEIDDVPVAIYCPACGCEQPAVSLQCLCCSVCGAPSSDIRRGSELELYALELMDEHPTALG